MKTTIENGITIIEEDDDIATLQPTISVIAAIFLEGYKLHITFSDNSKRIVDFEPKIRSFAPLHKFLNISLFRKFTIDNGNIEWNDYEMIFPVEDLLTM